MNPKDIGSHDKEPEVTLDVVLDCLERSAEPSQSISKKTGTINASLALGIWCLYEAIKSRVTLSWIKGVDSL